MWRGQPGRIGTTSRAVCLKSNAAAAQHLLSTYCVPGPVLSTKDLHIPSCNLQQELMRKQAWRSEVPLA